MVSLGICPDDGVSTSGFQLIDAPGISIKNLANIATETYGKGVDLALSKKLLAINEVRNDFIAMLQTNGAVATVFNPTYDCAEFVPGSSIGSSVHERGVKIHKTARRGNLRKTYIEAIQVYPKTNGTGDIKIYDGGDVYVWPVTFVANQVNTFDKASLGDFPFVVNSETAKVVINAPAVDFASSVLTCLQGCNGATPNDCGWVDGWDGLKSVKSEGYGINLKFRCECDYDQMICDLSRSFTGKLVWLKWQIEIWKEQYGSNRFNNWTIYNRDDIQKTVLPQLENEYNQQWQILGNGMPQILRTYRDECVSCANTIRWVTNL